MSSKPQFRATFIDKQNNRYLQESRILGIAWLGKGWIQTLRSYLAT